MDDETCSILLVTNCECSTFSSSSSSFPLSICISDATANINSDIVSTTIMINNN